MTSNCVFCSQPIKFMPGTHARFKGHIYSEAGRREVYNSGICEWCFDEVSFEPCGLCDKPIAPDEPYHETRNGMFHTKCWEEH